MAAKRGQWGSRVGFIMAAAGSAVGLGNLWKFPYITYENGGGIFVLIYLTAILMVGLPVMVAEIMIGRATQQNTVDAFGALAGKESKWTMVGWLGLAAGFIILSYYSVVGGWAMNYTLMSFINSFSGKSMVEISKIFDTFYSAGSMNLFWHSIFMCTTVGIVVSGVKDGIEKWSKILLPALFILLILLLINAMMQSGRFVETAWWMIDSGNPLKPSSVLEALGNAFFSLSLGMGAMLVYGSYLDKKTGILSSSLWITFLDTGIALVACLVIFPFAMTGGKMGNSVGLAFKTLPYNFSLLPGGLLVSIMFFLLLTFAAVTSAVSLLEVVTAFFIDREIFTRKKAAIFVGLGIYLFGIPSALAGSGALFSEWAKIFGMNFFDTFDTLATNWMLPFGGLMIAIFVGWFMKTEIREEEFYAGLTFPKWTYSVWLFLLRFVAPVMITLVFLNKVNIIKTEWLNEQFSNKTVIEEKIKHEKGKPITSEPSTDNDSKQE